MLSVYTAMSEKYILDGKKAIPCCGLLKWATWFEKADRVVSKTQVGDVEVSTVFIGLDHSFGGSKPLLFETMVFGGKHDQDVQRYGTWEEAELGHNAMVVKVSNSSR